MKPEEILSLYDREMRRDPPLEPGAHAENLGRVVRITGTYNCIIFSDLGSGDARKVVDEQTAFFRSSEREVEWKVYGHDRPRELPDLLREAGYVPDPPETLMVRDLSERADDGPIPSDIEVRQIRDGPMLENALSVSEDAFGTGEGWGRFDWRPRLADSDFAAFLAYQAGTPVAAGRLEMPSGRSFASLWGGGTRPEHRGRGIYRRLVAERADLARRRGFRFLTVDARETSRPILERVGFRPLDSTRGWVLKPLGPDA